MREKRVERLNSEFKKEINSILTNEIKDTRLTAIFSIVNVSITNDLSYADVHISLMGSDEEKKESFSVIENSAGYVRKVLGKRMRLRTIPQIRFKNNDYIEEGMRISKLIDEVNRNNKATE